MSTYRVAPRAASPAGTSSKRVGKPLPSGGYGCGPPGHDSPVPVPRRRNPGPRQVGGIRTEPRPGPAEGCPDDEDGQQGAARPVSLSWPPSRAWFDQARLGFIGCRHNPTSVTFAPRKRTIRRYSGLNAGLVNAVSVFDLVSYHPRGDVECCCNLIITLASLGQVKHGVHRGQKLCGKRPAHGLSLCPG